MTKTLVKMIPLAQIANKFDVRVELDQDRVLQFAGLYEGGVDLPPVKLVKMDEDEYAYIDGRTRGAARAYLNLPDVPAVILNGSLRENPFELYAEALESNWGGAKPPTRDDITHTIVRMVELGVTQKAIRERLRFLPSGSAKAYISTAISIVKKRRMSKALDAITEGLSLSNAANLYKVDESKLKDAIVGKKGAFGNRSQEKQLVEELRLYITKQLQSANMGISKKMTDLLRKVDDGEVSAALAESVIKAWYEHLRKSTIRADDWRARLAAITTEQDKAAAA